MNYVFGIDGCKAGWILAEEIHKNELNVTLFKSLSQLEILTKNEATVGIDIPLQIHDKGFRKADSEARALLKSRASSIFSAPAKKTLLAKTYKDACEVNFSVCGKKISKQTWFLFKKIKEARSLFCKKENYLKLYEVHPELSFMAMNNMKVLEYGKKTIEGFNFRYRLLKQVFPLFDFREIRAKFKKKDVADDDILDAVAVLWSTQKIIDKIASYVPKDPETPLSKIYY